MSAPNSDRSPLELTWPNKGRRLLAHGDSTYEWVDADDWRATEVRRLHEVNTVGEPSSGNLLIEGDALHALTALGKLPELAKIYLGQVKLCYIDPPFRTGQAFEHYDDALEHSVWLTMLRDRLVQIRELLCEVGSVWVHLDDNEVHRARSVLDEVFGAENFVATMVWEKTHTRENRATVSVSQDYIHLYAKNQQAWRAVRNLLDASEEQIARYSNPDDDPRGVWASLPAHAKAEKGRRQSQFFTVVTPSGRSVDPPAGRCWLFTRERFDEMVADDRIYFGPEGSGVPRVKKFLTEVQQGLVPRTWWPHDEVGTTGSAKSEITKLFPGVTPFSTPKPEKLMERVIHVGSDPGDIVLDCFAGSGTTAAVAHKMGRRWVTVEALAATVQAFTLPRLTKVVDGEDAGGVSSAAGWEGGGGFDFVRVAASMFEDYEGSLVLAPWATNGELSKAVAAQLGYEAGVDGPFAGTKGRSRLAVIDGMLTTGVADFLLAQLDDGQTLMAVAQTLEPGIEDHIRSSRSGSRARKVPRDLAKIGSRAGERVVIQQAIAAEEVDV